MSRIRPPMPFLSGFSLKMTKKNDTQISEIKHPMSCLYKLFHENVGKSSIPKYHELSIRCHFYMDFFHENVEKSSIPKYHELSIWSLFYLHFSMKMFKKSSIPKCHDWSIRNHFIYGLFHEKCPKKLDSYMPPKNSAIHKLVDIQDRAINSPAEIHTAVELQTSRKRTTKLKIT